jgi:hypothetical protein
MNTLLTCIFLYLLGPLVRSNSPSITFLPVRYLLTCLGLCCNPKRSHGIVFHTGNPYVAKRIERLLIRTFVGSCLVMISTVANMTQLTVFHGDELGFLCLILCNSDGSSQQPRFFHHANKLVTWTVIVFHWLSTSPKPYPKSSFESVLQCVTHHWNYPRVPTNTNQIFRARGRHVTAAPEDPTTRTLRRHTMHSAVSLELHSGIPVSIEEVQSTSPEPMLGLGPTYVDYTLSPPSTQQNQTKPGRDRRRSTPAVMFESIPLDRIRSQSLPR